jgi:hypothetical protein
MQRPHRHGHSGRSHQSGKRTEHEPGLEARLGPARETASGRNHACYPFLAADRATEPVFSLL